MKVFNPHFTKLYNNHRSPYANAIDFIAQREKFSSLELAISWKEFIAAVTGLKMTKPQVSTVFLPMHSKRWMKKT